MGFVDDIQNSLQREVDSAGRSVEIAQLKVKIKDVQARRKELAAQLGASLYEVTKSDPVLVGGREALFDGIDSLDIERAGYEAQIDEIERKSQEAQAAAAGIECPFCHYSMRGADLFCAGCGKPMAEVKAFYEQAPEPETASADAPVFCMNCGNKLGAGDKFCMKCGTKVPEANAGTADVEPASDVHSAPSSDDPVEVK